MPTNICWFNFHFQPNINVETTLGHRHWIDVIVSMLFQSCFVNVETTSINIRRLNFHFQPNINVHVFAGRCLAFIMMVLMMIFKSTVKNTPSSIWSGSVNTFHDIRILVKQLRKLIRNLISDVVKIIKLIIVMPCVAYTLILEPTWDLVV